MNLLEADDVALIVAFAGCSLAKTPGKKDSWIEAVDGELPEYICRIAKQLVATGKSVSAAIATAVNTVKRWAAGGTSSKSGPRAVKVHADTQAKAAAALVQWEALKAKAKGKKLATTQTSDGVITMSSKIAVCDEQGDVQYVSLCGHPFSIDEARRSYNEVLQAERLARSRLAGADDPYLREQAYGDLWIKEVWTNGILVEDGSDTYWVPFEYDGLDFKFGEKTEVKISYVPVAAVKEVIEDAVPELRDQQEHTTSVSSGGTVTYSTETVQASAQELSEKEADEEITRLTSMC